MSYTVKPKSVINYQINHQAVLTKISEEDRFVRFSFVVLDVSSKPPASGICNKSELEPGTQLYKWFSIFNGGELAEGDSVDPEDFTGLEVEVKLKKREKDGNEYTNVVDIIKLIP